MTLQSAVQEQGCSKDPPQSFCLAFWQLTRTEMFCFVLHLSCSLKEHTSWPDTVSLNPLPLTTGRCRVQAKPSAAILTPSFIIQLCHAQAPPNIGLEQESNTCPSSDWAAPWT